MVQVVATGAGYAMMARRTDATHDYILRLTGKERPRVLFLPTASGDRAEDIVSFYTTYHSDRCAPHHLNLFDRQSDDLDGYLRGFDVIVVAGGNTANMLDVWKRHGVDRILREMFADPAYSNVVFTGGSAGGMCWFEGGTTDSFGPTLRVLGEGLGMIKGSFCPHYDAQDQRRPLFHNALLAGELPAGYACGNLDSLHFNGTEFVTAISPIENGLALSVEARGGQIVETVLPMRKI